jgi:hypothetical protein
MVAAYADFLRAEPGEGADVADADRRLAAFIAERIEAAPESASGTRRAPRRRFELASPRRFALFAASAAVVLIAAFAVVRWQSAPDEMLLRGAGGGDRLATYTIPASGSMPLVWAPVAGADAYRVAILREDLVELVRIEPVAENTLVLAPAVYSIPAGRYFWEVTALAAGDPIAVAGPAPLFVR